MTTKLFVLNYEDIKNEVEIEGQIISIHVEVLSGDEVVSVTYVGYDGNFRMEVFDSAKLCGDPRCANYNDGEYDVSPYDKEEFDKWMQRDSVYGYLDGIV